MDNQLIANIENHESESLPFNTNLKGTVYVRYP